MICNNCNIEFESRRKDAKYCSPKCKKYAFLKRSTGTDKSQNGTDNVILAERINNINTETFKFYIVTKANGLGRKEDEKSATRTALYWYDVPLSAIPIIQKGWPKMPDYMNGRQYFLWWKNEFADKDGTPIIHNPFPTRENVKYEIAGEGARRWGA